jgi:hypothetical protein
MDLATLCPLTVPDALARTVALAPDVEPIVASDGRATFAELGAQVDLNLCSLIIVPHGDPSPHQFRTRNDRNGPTSLINRLRRARMRGQCWTALLHAKGSILDGDSRIELQR